MRKRMMEKLRKISTMYYLRQIITYWLACWMFFGLPAQVAMAATPAFTNDGGAAITQGADWTNVLVNQPQTIIEWYNFNTVDDELVAFTQLSTLSNSAVLNKISGIQTLFNGDLTGAGMRIFIVNPSGIVFGPTATVNVAQLVASGLNMTDQDFLDFTDKTITKMKFQGGPGGEGFGAGVTNQGTINAAVSAYLVGTQVLNTGTITSPIVVLAAGEKVYLNHLGSNVFIEMASDLETLVPANNTVDNSGTINATGQVLLAAGDVYSMAILGVENLAAVANGNIELDAGNGDFGADNMTLTADFDGSGEGNVDINTGVNLTGGDFTSGGVDFDNTGGAITTSASDIVINHTGELTIDSLEAGGEGNVSLTTISGDVIVNDVKALDNQITINSGGAILEYGTDAAADLTADTLDLTANDGISAVPLMYYIETAANTITARTIDTNKNNAHIWLSNNNDSPTFLIASTDGPVSSIEFKQWGVGELTLTDVSTTNGSIYITSEESDIVATLVNAGGPRNISLSTTTSGNVLVDDVKALDNQITINSAGAILENGNDAAADLTADTLDLTANDGIGDILYIETAANTITARTIDNNKVGANIWLSNDNISPTSLTASTVGTNSWVAFKQKGGGELTLTDVSTADGGIDIEADSGDIVAALVNKSGFYGSVYLTTLNSGDITVDNVTANNQITIDSAGAIKGFSVPTIFDPHLTADTLDLTANDGIGSASDYIQTAANTIIARTDDDTKTSAHIRLINDNSSPTSLTASTVGTDSWVRFSQRGGGELTLTDVSTVNGGIVIEAREGDIVATLVNAGGQFGDVYIYTYDSGDITVGSVTAGDSYVDISSAGSINDAADDTTVDITASDLGLTARAEIGGSPTAGKTFDTLGAIETDVETLNANSWGLGGDAGGGGDIVIVEKDNVELLDVVAESGSIFLEATNGGMTHIGEGVIKAGSSTLTLVQQEDLDLAGFYFDNQENTDLMVKVTNGEFIADDLVPENAADQWQSIQAIATDNIVLQGSDNEKDIKIGLHEGFEKDYLEFGGVVTSTEGGVSIISDKNTVRTAGLTMPILDNVTISGTSNDDLDIGVDLPYGIDTGKAAIVIMSAEDLMLGPGTILTASGTYDTTGAVDDREGVDFLDVPASIPSGFPRYEGDPFDVAIYLQSKDGDVDVSSTVSIMPYNLDGLRNGINGSEEPYEPEIVPQGAMVIDAWDTVTFDGGVPGGLFETSLAGNGVFSDVGDRLEVVSRITEWLFQAAGRLPYPSYPYYGGGPFPSDYTYTYVLRGAGLDNPAIAAITDDRSRAWVLVDPKNAPLDREAGENAEKQALGLDGCPVLLAAASAELGIPGETIEVSLANAYALNTDIQPCESCARLVNAAAILRDEDGSRMAAANQVFNALAPADAPFTPEVAASIVTAFAGRINDGTQYATAIEYIDAFVRYIAVLSTEMGSPVGDSLAFVMDKYGAGVLGSDNSNIAAFVATRLESGETFGK